MGSQLDLQNESDKNYLQAIHQIGKIVYYRVMRPWTNSNFLFYNFHPKAREEKRLLKIINDFTDNVIKKRQENFKCIEEPSADPSHESFNYFGRKKIAMLDLLLNAKLTNGSINDEGIRDEVNTFLFEVKHANTIKCVKFETFQSRRFILNYKRHLQEAM